MHSLHAKRTTDPSNTILLKAVTALHDSCIHYAVTSLCERELFASTSDETIETLNGVIQSQTMPLDFFTHVMTAFQNAEPEVCRVTFQSLFGAISGHL